MFLLKRSCHFDTFTSFVRGWINITYTCTKLLYFSAFCPALFFFVPCDTEDEDSEWYHKVVEKQPLLDHIKGSAGGRGATISQPYTVNLQPIKGNNGTHKTVTSSIKYYPWASADLNKTCEVVIFHTSGHTVVGWMLCTVVCFLSVIFVPFPLHKRHPTNY